MTSSPYKVFLGHSESAKAHGSIPHRLPHANPFNSAVSYSPSAPCFLARLGSFARTPSAIPRPIPDCASLSTRPAACNALPNFPGTADSQTSSSTPAPGPLPLPTLPIARPNFQRTIPHPPIRGLRCSPPSPSSPSPSACRRFPCFLEASAASPLRDSWDGNLPIPTPALLAASPLSSTHTNAA